MPHLGKRQQGEWGKTGQTQPPCTQKVVSHSEKKNPTPKRVKQAGEGYAVLPNSWRSGQHAATPPAHTGVSGGFCRLPSAGTPPPPPPPPPLSEYWPQGKEERPSFEQRGWQGGDRAPPPQAFPGGRPGGKRPSLARRDATTSMEPRPRQGVHVAATKFPPPLPPRT